MHLVRRTSRRTALERRSCFVADTSREAVAARGSSCATRPRCCRSTWTAASAVAGPLYAVCTHGKRDPCCARRGRPLARALRAARPDETWEIGHIGGHRFAATFLAFPHGLCFGRVPAARGPEIVAALEAGEIVLEHFRGRAGDPPVVQAADVLVRRRLGLRGIDDVGGRGRRRRRRDAAHARRRRRGSSSRAARPRRARSRAATSRSRCRPSSSSA